MPPTIPLPYPVAGNPRRESPVPNGDVLLLVRQIAAEDRGAFALLYDALAGRLLADVTSAMSDPRCAEAVVCATFLEVWSLARFHTGSATNVYAWMSSIVARRITDREPAAAKDSDSDGSQGRPVPARRQLRWAAVADSYDHQTRIALAALLGRPAGRRPAEPSVH